MILVTLAVVVVTAGGGSCKDIGPRDQPANLCSHPSRLYPDPDNCRKFLKCVNRKPVSMWCPLKTRFDPVMQICIWREDVDHCGLGNDETDAGQRDVQNVSKITRDFHRNTTENKDKIKVRSQPSAKRTDQLTTAGSSKHKSKKVEMDISFQKVKEPTEGFSITKLPTTHDKMPPGNELDFRSFGQDDTLSSVVATMTSTRPSILSNETSSFLESDTNKWYHKMNAEMTSGIKNLSSVRDSQNPTKPGQQQTDSSTPSSDKQPYTNDTLFQTSPAGNTMKFAPVLAHVNASKDVTSDLLENEIQERSNEPRENTTHLRYRNNYAIKGEIYVDNKDNKTENVEGYRAKSLDNVTISPTVLDDNEITDKDGEGDAIRLMIPAWVNTFEQATHDVKADREPVKKTGLSNLYNDTQINLQPSTPGDNRTGMLDDVSHLTPGSVGDDIFEATERLNNSFQVKDVTRLPQEEITADSTSEVDVGKLIETFRAQLDRKFRKQSPAISKDNFVEVPATYTDNSVDSHETWAGQQNRYLPTVFKHLTGKIVNRDLLMGDSISEVDGGKLIEPFRARVDRKFRKQSPEISEDNFVEVPATYTDNSVDSHETWAGQENIYLPTVFKHLTGKIVNRDLLMAERKVIKPRWYDLHGVPDIQTTNPTTTQTSTPSLGTINVVYQQYAITEEGYLATPKTPVLNTPEEGEDRGSPLVKEAHPKYQSYPNLPTPPTRLHSTTDTGADVEKGTTREPSSNVDPLLTLPFEIMKVTGNKSLESTPYMTKGLPVDFGCPESDGNFPDPVNCAAYYHCSRGQAYRRSCAPGQVFYYNIRSCVYSNLVPPCSKTNADTVKDDKDIARYICKDPNGLYRDNVSCAHFFECTNGWPIRRQCMLGTVFDYATRKCSWSKFVPGCELESTPDVEISISGSGRGHFQCPRDGYFRDPSRCDVYYLCTDNQALRMTCDPGTSFDVTLNMCVWRHLVNDCKGDEGYTLDKETDMGTAPTSSSSVTEATTTSQKTDFKCPERNGIYPAVEDCGVYYVCTDGSAQQMSCPQGFGYDVTSGLCLERAQVPQCKVSGSSKGEIPDPAPTKSAAKFTCPEDHGLFTDARNCSFFIHCFKKVAYKHECLPGTMFSLDSAACTWSQLVAGCPGSGHDKPGTPEEVATNSVGYSTKGHGRVQTEPYQPHLPVTEPAFYKITPVELQDFICPDVDDGFFRDKVFCDLFHRCVMGKKFSFTCPAGTFFRLEQTLCDYWASVTDCTKDGLRLEAMGSLPDVVTLPPAVPVQQQVPEQVELNIVNTEADPTECPASTGLFPHPRNCRQFIFCSRFVPLILTCPEPLLFNRQTLTCDFANKVHCFRSNAYGRK